MAVNLFTGATNSNWGTSTNWSQGTVPTATDGHVTTFSVASPNCTVNTSIRVCNNLDFTGYINTITISNAITVSGNLTLSVAMIVAGTQNINVNATGNLTSNGFTFPNSMTFSGTSQTFTLQDNWIITGLLSLGGTTGMTFNNNGTAKTFTSNGGFITATAGVIGTAKFIVKGTGTFSTLGTVQNDLDINATSLTAGASLRFSTGTFKYIAGTIDLATNSNTLILGAASIDLNGITWNNVSTPTSGTITLISDLTFSGTYTNTAGVTLNGSTLVVNGTLVTAGSQILLGTTVLKFAGTSCVWTGASGTLRLNTNIDCGAGTLTISGIVNYNTGTLTYITGTVVTTGSTLNIIASTTLNTNGVIWNDVTIPQSIQTLNSTLSGTGILNVCSASSVTFIGTSGFSFATFRCVTPNRTINLKAGNTYTVTTLLFLQGIGTGATQRINLISSIASTYAFFNLVSGATCHVVYVNPIDMDSSGGRIITDVKGTLLRTVNWYVTNPDNYFYF